jgi:hypothetical protein
MTQEPNIATTSPSAPLAVVSPLALVDRVGQSSDDLEDAILGPLPLDFSNDAIDTVISSGSTDIGSGLMDGG